MLKGYEALRALRRDPYVVAASLTANVLGLAVPIAMIQIYDRIIPNAAVETLTALGIGVGLALLAELILRLARGQMLAIAGARFERQAYQDTVAKLIYEDPSRATNDAPGHLINTVSGIDRLRNFHAGDSAAALLDLPFIVLFLGLILLISPPLALVVLAMLMVAFGLAHAMRRQIVHLNAGRQTLDDRRQSFLIETLQRIDVVRSLGAEDFMQRRYERLMAGSARIGANLSIQMQMTQGITSAIGLVAPLITASAGAALVMTDRMSIGALAAVVLLSGRIVQPVLRIEALLVGEQDTKRSLVELERIAVRPQRQSGERALASVDEVTLENITWRAKPDAPPIFENLSLTLRRGECIAVTGAAGAGRSLLLRLLAGDRDPTEGALLVNGHPIQAYQRADVAARIRLVTRRNVLLEGSLLENMADFEPERYRMQALELAQALGLDRFVAQHREGLGFRVGQGGERHLPVAIADTVGIVASLVSSPDVILFDEANTGLDQRHDRLLTEWLAAQKPERIIVLVSHRPSLLAIADRTLRIDAGRLRKSAPAPVLDLRANAKRVA